MCLILDLDTTDDSNYHNDENTKISKTVSESLIFVGTSFIHVSSLGLP